MKLDKAVLAMSCLDPRQFLLSSFYMDPAANSLLMANLASNSAASAASNFKKSDKMNSFNISQLLSSSVASDTSSRLDDDGPDSELDNMNHSSDDVLQLMTTSCAEDESRSSSRRDSPSESSTSPTSGAIKKARKARTIFTDKQLQELETTFEKQKYLSVQDRMELANKMGLSDTQVKTWYQNRRTKWKRQASVGIDLLNEAGNFAAVQQVLRSNPYWASYLSSAPGLAAAAAATPTRMPQPHPGAMAAFLPAGLTSFPGAAGFPANLQFLSFMPTPASLNGQTCISTVSTPNATPSISSIAHNPSSPIKLDLDVSSDKSD